MFADHCRLSFFLFLALFLLLPGEDSAKAQGYPPYGCSGKACLVAPAWGADGKANPSQVYVLSYGNSQSRQNILFSGLKTIDCAAFGGTHVKDFNCQIQPIDLPDLKGWKACTPDSNGNCYPTLASHHYVIARWGNSENWIYQFVSSTFTCPTSSNSATSFSGIRINPVTGVNESSKSWGCEISTVSGPRLPGAVWTTCAASDGVQCRFPSAGSFLVRYLDNSGSSGFFPITYRLVTGDGILCSADAFGAPKQSSTIRGCEYLALPSFLTMQGNWSLVGLCANCGDVTFAASTGVETGKTKENEKSWAAEASVTVGYSAGVPAIMQTKAEATVTVRNERNSVVTDSFNQKSSTDVEVECGSGALYQWVAGVDRICMPGDTANCRTVARTPIFRCLPTNLAPGSEPKSSGSPLQAFAEPGEIAIQPAARVGFTTSLDLPKARTALETYIDPPSVSSGSYPRIGLVTATDVGDGWIVTETPVAGGKTIMRVDDSGMGWVTIPGGATRIGGTRAEAWIANESGAVFRWTGTEWQYVPGKAAKDIGDGWIVSDEETPGGYKIYKYDRDSNIWTNIPGGATRIGGTYAQPWIVSSNGSIFRFVDGGWKNESPENNGRATYFKAIDVGHGWAISDNNGLYRFTGIAIAPGQAAYEWQSAMAAPSVTAVGGDYKNPYLVSRALKGVLLRK